MSKNKLTKLQKEQLENGLMIDDPAPYRVNTGPLGLLRIWKNIKRLLWLAGKSKSPKS